MHKRKRKGFDQPLRGDVAIRREDVVQLIGRVLVEAKLSDREHAEDRVNQRLRSSKPRTRKINRLVPERPGVNQFRVSKVAVWAALEWPSLDFSSVFQEMEPASATSTTTLGAATLSATVRVVPPSYEECKTALLQAWAKIDELEGRAGVPTRAAIGK
jgi:hypothetical protein